MREEGQKVVEIKVKVNHITCLMLIWVWGKKLRLSPQNHYRWHLFDLLWTQKLYNINMHLHPSRKTLGNYDWIDDKAESMDKMMMMMIQRAHNYMQRCDK